MTAELPPALKQLGQNFLIDPNIVRKIVDAAALRPDDTVLEIGPGRGALTRLLCARAARVVAVEIDPLLCTYLREVLAECRTLTLVEADALQWPFDDLPDGTVVVANLPYYVSTPLLFRLLHERDRFARAVLMLQSEVAQRLVAQPGTKEYGVLSVMAQIQAEARILFRVSPNCFRPRPDVESSVISLVRRPDALPAELLGRVERVVRRAFAHRRKTLVNSLRDAGYDGMDATVVVKGLGLETAVRAEDVTIGQFVDLAHRLREPPG